MNRRNLVYKSALEHCAPKAGQKCYYCSGTGRCWICKGTGDHGGQQCGRSNFAARAEPTLLGDENDLGDYTLSSTYSSACPVTPLGSAFVRFPVGTFRQTYAYRYYIPQQGQHWYSVSCIGPCTAPYQQNRYFSQYRGPFYVCTGIKITIFGSPSCLGRCSGSNFDAGCY
jgi:hypothetical protein